MYTTHTARVHCVNYAYSHSRDHRDMIYSLQQIQLNSFACTDTIHSERRNSVLYGTQYGLSAIQTLVRQL